MPSDWDTTTYDRISDPMAGWGAELLERLELRGDERVLDAGCGSGRVTRLLLERLPRGSVIAVDASPSMIEEARAQLAPWNEQVEFLVADLGGPLSIAPVDAVFSNATFHWIPDHDALFSNLATVLRRRGRLVAQCGGAGNIARVIDAVRDVTGEWRSTTVFATPERTRTRLGAAGFVDVETWLHPEPTIISPSEALETYLETVILREQVMALPKPERRAFIRAVAERLPSGEIDYIRLNIAARRG